MGEREEPGIRRADAADLVAITRFLEEQRLPTDGVADWIALFWVAVAGDRLVGVAGVELYDNTALLRSVAVDPGWRGTGLGRRLTDLALDAAESAGAQEIYLLTTTADRYFPRVGFSRVSRETVPTALMASREFQGACPASAVVMRRHK